MVITMLVSHLLSAIESYVPSKTDFRQFDAMLNTKLRICMKGRACQFDAEGSAKKRPNKKVLQYWRLVPLALEARVRRLLFFQSLVADPNNHRLVLAAVFGRARFEDQNASLGKSVAPPPLLQNGAFNSAPAADPWLQQIDEDLLSLYDHDVFSDFTTEWNYHDRSYLSLSRDDSQQKLVH